MNTDDIKKLLDKYYEAETTREEEALLRSMLSDDTSDAFLPDRDLSGFIEREKTDSLSPEFDWKLKKLLDGRPVEAKKLITSGLLFKISAVAAAIILMIGIIRQFESRDDFALPNTYSDPLLAYQETKKTLYTVSYKLNSSMEKLNKLEKINKALESLNTLQKLEKYSDRLTNIQ